MEQENNPKSSPLLKKNEEIEAALSIRRPRLEKYGFKSLASVACSEPEDLAGAAGTNLQTANSIRIAAISLLAKGLLSRERTNRLFITTADKIKITEISNAVRGIPTGSTNIDSLFGGTGIETGVITQFYGESGSGKTQLCHTLSAQVAANHKVVYIDSEGTFISKRVNSIAKARGSGTDKLLENIMVVSPANTDQQEQFIDSIPVRISQNSPEMKLLIVVIMTDLYTIDYPNRSDLQERQRRISKYMHILRRIALQHNVAVIVTNHVHTYHEKYKSGRKFTPIGGNAMAYLSQHRVRLERLYLIKFQAELDHSYRHPINAIDFIINENGVTDPPVEYEEMSYSDN